MLAEMQEMPLNHAELDAFQAYELAYKNSAHLRKTL